jgi:hypothetical protein
MLCRRRKSCSRGLHEMCVCKLFEGANFAILDTPDVCSSRFELSAGLAMLSSVGPHRNDGLVAVYEALEGEVESLPVAFKNVENVVDNLLFVAEYSSGWKSVAFFPDDIIGEILLEGFQI